MPEDFRSEGGGDPTDVDPSLAVHRPRGDPRPAAVTFVTTEHFTLQGARAATIAESTGRASMFLVSVSGGLVALGLVATSSRVGTAFYAFGLILLPTLTFVGFVTFERVMQSGFEDLDYARRIARLRGYYFDQAPELASYLMSVPGPEPLRALGLSAGGRWQAFRTVAAMVAVITAVLAGSVIGLLTAVASEHSLAAALVAGGVVAVASLAAMMRLQESAWERATSGPASFDAEGTEPVQSSRAADRC